jgi:isopentenyldiphosphate isomerase
MESAAPAFDYPASLQEYAVNEAEYLRQHPEYHVLCTGAVVFDKNGKLLLVQRAADEKAFPNLWVREAIQDVLAWDAIL